MVGLSSAIASIKSLAAFVLYATTVLLSGAYQYTSCDAQSAFFALITFFADFFGTVSIFGSETVMLSASGLLMSSALLMFKPSYMLWSLFSAFSAMFFTRNDAILKSAAFFTYGGITFSVTARGNSDDISTPFESINKELYFSMSLFLSALLYAPDMVSARFELFFISPVLSAFTALPNRFQYPDVGPASFFISLTAEDIIPETLLNASRSFESFPSNFSSSLTDDAIISFISVSSAPFATSASSRCFISALEFAVA